MDSIRVLAAFHMQEIPVNLCREATLQHIQKAAYDLVLEAIDRGAYRPGDRLVETRLRLDAERYAAP